MNTKLKDKPTDAEISKAIRVLSDYRLHYYQLLFFQHPKLTQPSKGYPFHTSIDPERMGCINIEFVPEKSYNFWINSSEDDEKLLEKCKLILTAHRNNKVKVDQQACCPLASFRNCVCVVSYACPIHGTRCIGSHD